MTIFVANLNFSATELDVKELFEKFGQVESVDIPLSTFPERLGRPRGFAFVKMPHGPDASRAIEELNSSEFRGRRIRVEIANRDRAHEKTFDA